MIDLKALCSSVALVAIETGQAIATLRLEQVPHMELKGKNDLVTHLDKQSEHWLVQKLETLLPQAGFIAEEGTSTKTSDRLNWIVDPIDGTTNFYHGTPPYAISIALQQHHEVVLAVVYEMGQKECFYAWKNGGAYLNHAPIKVSERLTVADSLIATGFPYNNFDRLDPYLNSLRHLMQQARGIRRMGSAATDLAYVACGRFDAFYEYDLKPWDVAAGALLVQEAGGVVSDFSGTSHFLYGKEIVASNHKIFPEFQQLINRHLKLS